MQFDTLYKGFKAPLLLAVYLNDILRWKKYIEIRAITCDAVEWFCRLLIKTVGILTVSNINYKPNCIYYIT